MNITQDLQKWGNSTGVRLPMKVLSAAKFKPNQKVEISLKGQSIVLSPVRETDDFTIDDMLKGVTPADIGGEYDWGEDVGAEVIDG